MVRTFFYTLFTIAWVLLGTIFALPGWLSAFAGNVFAVPFFFFPPEEARGGNGIFCEASSDPEKAKHLL